MLSSSSCLLIVFNLKEKLSGDSYQSYILEDSAVVCEHTKPGSGQHSKIATTMVGSKLG